MKEEERKKKEFLQSFKLFYCANCRKELGFKEPIPCACFCKKCYKKIKRELIV